MRASWGVVLLGLSASCAAPPPLVAPQGARGPLSVRGIDQVSPTATGSSEPGDGTTSKERLPPEVIQGTVRARFPELRACYERLLARDRAAQGRTATRFVIDPEGAVKGAETMLSGSLTPEVGTCIEGVFEKLTFPPPGGKVTVTYPIVFTPSE